MKKRMNMECVIVLTFMIILVVAVILNGINNVVVMNSNFFTPWVWLTSITSALIYLAFIWLNTRKHRLLAGIGMLAVFSIARLILDIIPLSSYGAPTATDWYEIIYIIFISLPTYFLGTHHAEKLLKEDKSATTKKDDDNSDDD